MARAPPTPPINAHLPARAATAPEDAGCSPASPPGAGRVAPRPSMNRSAAPGSSFEHGAPWLGPRPSWGPGDPRRCRLAGVASHRSPRLCIAPWRAITPRVGANPLSAKASAAQFTQRPALARGLQDLNGEDMPDGSPARADWRRRAGSRCRPSVEPLDARRRRRSKHRRCNCPTWHRHRGDSRSSRQRELDAR